MKKPLTCGLYPEKRTLKEKTPCCRMETTTGGYVMSRSYVKVENLAEEVFRRKAAGETNREIGERFGLTKEQVKQLATRQRRKQRLIENGYIPRPKGRPRKSEVTEEIRKNNELTQLRMQVALLQNFLLEVGRR